MQIFLFLILVLNIGQIFAEPPTVKTPDSSRTIQCSDPENPENGKTIVAEFLLSKALKFQAETLRNNEKRKEQHEQAIKYFNEYIECMVSQKFLVSGLTYYQKAISQFEIGDKDAHNTLDLALKQDSRLRDAIVLRARIFIRDKKYKDAQNLLEEAISYFSDDSDILYILGSLNTELGNDSKALLYFGSLWNNIQKKEGDPRYTTNVLKVIAELLSKRLEHDRTVRYRAIYYLKTYLKYKPMDKEAKFVLSLLLSYSGKMDEARSVLLEIIEMDNEKHSPATDLLAEIYFITNPTDAYRYMNFLESKGWIKPKSHIYFLHLVLKGRYKEAKEGLEASAKKNQNRISTFIALIEIYKKFKNTEGLMASYLTAARLSYSYKDNLRAIQYMKELIKYGEKNPDLKEPLGADYDFIATCYEDLGSNHLALINVRSAIEKANDTKEKDYYRLHEANLLRSPSLKRYDDSIKILNSILENRPDSGPVYFALGLNYYLIGKYRESVDYYSWAIDFEPSNSTYYYYRASSYEKLNYIQETRKDLLRSLDLEPNFAMAYNFLGYLYAEKNIELDESLKLIRKAIDLEPDNSAFQDSLGWVMYRFGKLEEALHHLQLAKQLMEEKKEEDPTIYDHLGDVFFKLNDQNSARENWIKAEQLFTEKVEKTKVQEKIKSLDTIQK